MYYHSLYSGDHENSIWSLSISSYTGNVPNLCIYEMKHRDICHLLEISVYGLFLSFGNTYQTFNVVKDKGKRYFVKNISNIFSTLLDFYFFFITLSWKKNGSSYCIFFYLKTKYIGEMLIKIRTNNLHK